MKMKKWQMWTLAAVVVIGVGVGCLFGGKAWGDNGSSTNDGSNQTWADGNRPSGMPGDGSMPAGAPGGRNGGNMVSGSIIAIDADSITVQTTDGSTKIVLVGSSATISLVTAGSASDLKTGENVVVSGTTNTDGTVTATSIRLGEVFSQITPSGAPPAAGSETTTTQATTN
jgi:hypothetical protein